MSDDDAELVALIDSELDAGRRAGLSADDGLRQRYEALRRTGAPLAAAFDVLLEQAPLTRLRTAVPAEDRIRRSRRFAGIAFRELAAGLVIGVLAAGATIWAASTFGLFDGREDWRSAIAEYTQLYTNETFSPLNPDADAAQQAAELKAVGAIVGAKLTPENTTLPDLRFVSAFMLSYGAHRWASSLTWILWALRSCFVFLLMARLTNPLNRRGAATCRSPGGRVAAEAIWSSAMFPRSGPSLWRR